MCTLRLGVQRSYDKALSAAFWRNWRKVKSQLVGHRFILQKVKVVSNSKLLQEGLIREASRFDLTYFPTFMAFGRLWFKICFWNQDYFISRHLNFCPAFSWKHRDTGRSSRYVSVLWMNISVTELDTFRPPSSRVWYMSLDWSCRQEA